MFLFIQSNSKLRPLSNLLKLERAMTNNTPAEPTLTDFIQSQTYKKLIEENQDDLKIMHDCINRIAANTDEISMRHFLFLYVVGLNGQEYLNKILGTKNNPPADFEVMRTIINNLENTPAMISSKTLAIKKRDAIIEAMTKEGFSAREISDKHNIPYNTVWYVKRRLTKDDGGQYGRSGPTKGSKSSKLSKRNKMIYALIAGNKLVDIADKLEINYKTAANWKKSFIAEITKVQKDEYVYTMMSNGIPIETILRLFKIPVKECHSIKRRFDKKP